MFRCGIVIATFFTISLAGFAQDRKGPLAELPSKPGPHVEKIKAMGDNEWLNLGAPAADQKWGKARGSSWGAKALILAPDKLGAFLFGKGAKSYLGFRERRSCIRDFSESRSINKPNHSLRRSCKSHVHFYRPVLKLAFFTLCPGRQVGNSDSEKRRREEGVLHEYAACLCSAAGGAGADALHDEQSLPHFAAGAGATGG